jgi:hypothetical protein
LRFDRGTASDDSQLIVAAGDAAPLDLRNLDRRRTGPARTAATSMIMDIGPIIE